MKAKRFALQNKRQVGPTGKGLQDWMGKALPKPGPGHTISVMGLAGAGASSKKVDWVAVCLPAKATGSGRGAWGGAGLSPIIMGHMWGSVWFFGLNTL